MSWLLPCCVMGYVISVSSDETNPMEVPGLVSQMIDATTHLLPHLPILRLWANGEECTNGKSGKQPWNGSICRNS